MRHEIVGSKLSSSLKLKLVSIAVALFICPATVLSDSLQEGVAAIRDGRYEEAIVLVLPLAEKGDPQAENIMGAIYVNGWGVEPNVAEALRWYGLAAEHGDARAYFNLGQMYATGNGVDRDCDKALDFFSKPAAAGDPIAQVNLGGIYADGSECLPQDDSSAVRWYRAAADQGDPLGQHGIGSFYARGKGVDQDYVEAMAWYRKAAEQGYRESQTALGSMYQFGEGVEPDLDKAMKWYRLAAEQGHQGAQERLKLLEAGDRLPANTVVDKSHNNGARDGVYTSPDKSFQFKIPKLIEPGASVDDVRESEIKFKVVMGDELCRRAYVVQYAKEAYGNLEAFTGDRVAAMQIVDIESQELSDPHPGAVLITGGMPHVSNCAAMKFGEGGQLVPVETAGSDVGVIFLESENAFYELGYVLDQESTIASLYGVSDIEKVLGALFAGFRITGPRVVASLPPVVPLIRFVGRADDSQCELIGRIKGKSSSMAWKDTVSEHMSKAKAILRQEAEKLGGNAILIRQSKMKTSGWTKYPYMQMKADAFVCDSVPEYMAWEIRATR